MELITLYPHKTKEGKEEIHFNYGKISKEGGIIVEKTREQVDFLSNGDLPKVMKKLRQRYEQNQPEEVKYTLISCSKEMKDIINGLK